jgi:NADH-quinone oxidoreductase subunit L
MTVPLWALMIGSIVAGLLWVPHVWSPFEHWLEPVMTIDHEATVGVGVEFTLMFLSVVVALGGIGLAYLMYYRGALRPETFSEALGGVPYRIVLNKYYVDELYELVFVRGGVALCRLVAWFDLHVIDGIVNLCATVVRGWARVTGLFDQYVVDGCVNGVAGVTQFVGRRVRNLQTGAISAYLYVVILGVLGSVLLYWSWAAAS